MEKRTFQQLLNKYLSGTANPAEQSLIEEYYKRLSQDQPAQQLTAEEENHLQQIMLANILQATGEQQKIKTLPKRRINPVWRIATAAGITLAIGITGYYYYTSNQQPFQQTAQQQPAQILPGSNKAILTLADGKQISLTDAANGSIAQQAGVQITKTKDGQLNYAIANNTAANPQAYNTIETPKGGQYQVNLPDGTKVWLNAQSSLKYPANFTGSERRVELTGEAYFEVVHNARQPFRVVAANQLVEDIGTHFNVSAYSDEANTRTTLLEGAVRVNNSKTLVPGQQASTTASGALKINEVDTEDIVAWKNGLFQFSHEPLESIMRKVARWYNVEVEYQDESLKDITTSGTVSRFGDVNTILKRLEMTGQAKFRVEGRKILISK